MHTILHIIAQLGNNNFINACYDGIIHFLKNITNKKGDFYLCQEMKDLVKLFLLVMVL